MQIFIKMAEKILLVLIILISCVQLELFYAKYERADYKYYKNSSFHEFNSTVYPWILKKREAPKIIINGIFKNNTHVGSQKITAKDSKGKIWYSVATFFNSTYYAEETISFSAYINWPKRSSTYEIILNLISGEIIACWKMFFFIL